ncbi:MAG: HAMP domain-containing histidine kinase [Methanobacteriota archaeon]|nr:MAG: HAMP domain-containing histidine kinase [Euryarchaeota archaeon]
MQKLADSRIDPEETIHESATHFQGNVADILRLIARAESLETLFDRIAFVLLSRFAVESLTICLLDDDAGCFRPVLVRGFSEEQAKAIKKHEYTLERKGEELRERFRMGCDCYHIRAVELRHLSNDHTDYINDVSKIGSMDAFRDLDHIDFPMRDRLGNVVGWIEIDEPNDPKALSPETTSGIRMMTDLAAIAVESSKMYGDVIAAMKESKEEIDTMVREIGNLIDPLSHYIETARKDSPPLSEAAFHLDKSVALVSEARRIIDNARRLAEIRHGGAATRHAFDLKQVLVKCIATIRKDFPDKEVVIDFDFPNEECIVIADDLITDLFSNLLGNAVKHCRADEAEIDVMISNSHDSWIVQIDDHGVGIPDDRKKSMLSSLERRHGSSDGPGLGMSIVNLLVSRYNGLISLRDRVEGDYSHGTSFEVVLPRASDGPVL